MTSIRASTSRDVGSDRAERFAREHPGLVKLGRIGWVAKGVVYLLTGILATVVAFQAVDGGTGANGRAGSGEEASQSGAIAAIAESGAGATLLVVIAFGLALYVIWRVVSIMLPADNDVAAWLTRAGYAVSAVTYVALAWTALSFARHRGSSSNGQNGEDARVERFTRDLLGTDGGRILVFGLGVVLLCVAAYFLYKGLAAKFESDLSGRGVGPLSHGQLVTMGRIGWVGRALMMGLIGVFLARAAINVDPDEAEGLDDALRRVADSTPGTILVMAVAVGLVFYGAFCIVSAPRRRLTGAD